MGVRTLCFVLAFFAEGWLRWTCVVLAVLLPYVAVVIANAVGPRTGTPNTLLSTTFIASWARFGQSVYLKVLSFAMNGSSATAAPFAA